jgi:hypothetical protein
MLCARCDAAPTRNVMAARSRPSSALVHPSCTTCSRFVETRRHSRYLHASHQCNRDAIRRGQKNALRLARFQHVNSYLSAYRQLRVSVSNGPRLHMLYGTTGCYRGRCTSVRESASPFWLGEGTRLSPPRGLTNRTCAIQNSPFVLLGRCQRNQRSHYGCRRHFLGPIPDSGRL